MFVTDDLIYLQLPKSGCNSSTKIIEELCGGGVQRRIHEPLTNYQTSKKILGNVRNPWDWYVSLWSYGCSGRSSLHKRLTQYQSKFFFKTLRSLVYPLYELALKDVKKWNYLYSDVNDPELFRSWLREMYSEKNQRWIGEWYMLHPVKNYAGYYTFRYGKLYIKDFMNKREFDKYGNYDSLLKQHEQNFLLDYIIHTENLEEETYGVLSELGFTDTRNQRQTKTVKLNNSKHHTSEIYYNDELIELVGIKEKLIIDLYGYEFPSS